MAPFISLSPSMGCTAAHCLAEVYAVLTGMPGKDRVSPDEALLFIADVRERLAIIAPAEADYMAVITSAGKSGLVDGGIYDALLAQCALSGKAGALYTWNAKHFVRLGSHVARIVKRP